MTDQPNPALIFETLNAHQRTGALKAGIELKIFTILGGDAKTAPDIAAACKADPRGVRILCDFLTIMGLLKKQEDTYTNSPKAAAFLNEQAPGYMGKIAGFVASDEMLDTFRDVAGAVRKGGTLLPEGGTTKLDNELWVEFAKSMAPMMKPPADFIAAFLEQRLPAPGPQRVLDIAAGHGLFGITVAQKFSQAEIVAQDFEAVLGVASANAETAGVASRHSLLPGDAFQVAFEGTFDAVLITNFLHHFDEATCIALLEKVNACLNPGGLVITLEFIPDENRVTPESPASFALTMLTSTAHGDAYTFDEYRQMFEKAGFSHNELVQIPNSPQRIVASKA